MFSAWDAVGEQVADKKAHGKAFPARRAAAVPPLQPRQHLRDPPSAHRGPLAHQPPQRRAAETCICLQDVSAYRSSTCGDISFCKLLRSFHYNRASISGDLSFISYHNAALRTPVLVKLKLCQPLSLLAYTLFTLTPFHTEPQYNYRP